MNNTFMANKKLIHKIIMESEDYAEQLYPLNMNTMNEQSIWIPAKDKHQSSPFTNDALYE